MARRPADGRFSDGASRMRVDVDVADPIRAEAVRRGIGLSEMLRACWEAYLAQGDVAVPKTVIDPPKQKRRYLQHAALARVEARHPREPLIVQVPTLLSRINDQLRPPVESPAAPPTAPTMPSPAPEPPTGAQEALLSLFDAALRRRGLEPAERLGGASDRAHASSAAHAAALQEVYATAETMAAQRGRSPAQLFAHWVEVYLDACKFDAPGREPSPIDMAMQMYRLVAS